MPDTPLTDLSLLRESNQPRNFEERSASPNIAYTGLDTSGLSLPGDGPAPSALTALQNSIKGPSDLMTGGSKLRSLGESMSNRYDNFVPGDYNNEDAYALGQGWTDKMANAVGKGLAITGTTFLQSTVGLVNGLARAKMDGRLASFYDNEFNRQLDELNKKLEDALPNYYTDAEKAANWYSPSKLFSANFFWDGIIKNMGFAAGAALAGNVYAGAISGVANALKVIPGAARLISVGRAAEALAATEEGLLAANKGAEAYGKLSSLSNRFLGQYNVLSKGQRAIVAGLATTGEAGFEAYNNMNEFRNKRIEEYKSINGVEPTGAALERINKEAEGVGNSSLWANIGLLSATNYIQFPKILGSSYKAEKGIVNSLAKEIDDVVFDSAAGKYIAKAPRFGKLINTVDKIRPYTFSIAEGFEEGAQYAVQASTQDYYNKKYNNQATSWLSSLSEGITQTLTTNEGMENVLIGGLSGALMTARSRYSENKEIADNTAKAIQQFSNYQLSSFTKDTIDSVNRGTVLQEEREKLLRQGDILESKDKEADYVINYLTPRIKYGRFDLVKDDINTYRQLASTEEGFAQLQAEGKALSGDTRPQYLQRLSNLENTAENIHSLYQSLNLRYGGLIDADKKKVYNDEVMDKMVYAATKISDYDNRSISLVSDLISQGITNTSEITSSIIAGDSEAYNKALEGIENRKDINDDQKADIAQNLVDLSEIALRRNSFIKEYDDIKKNPAKYTAVETKEEDKETTTEPGAVKEPGAIKETVSIKTKDGEENVEVGEEYFLGKVVEYSKDGKEVYRFPRLTILGDNGDGTIKIKEANGTIRDVSKEVLADYKLGKVSDTLNNKKAKYFLEHANTAFEFNFGKGNKVKGRLQYSSKDGVLEFVYRDKKGKIKSIEVSGKQFVPQKGYNKAIITAVGELTAAQKQAEQEFSEEKDAKFEAKQEARLKVIAELHDEVSEKLSKTKQLLDRKYSELETIVKDITTIENKLKGGEMTKTNAFKRTTANAIKTASKLSKLKDQLVNEIQELEAEKENLEFNQAYLNDVFDSIDLMNVSGSEFLEDLKEQKTNIEDLIIETGNNINTIAKLIDGVQGALDQAVDLALDLIKKFDTKYPNLPYTPLALQEYLLANPEVRMANPNLMSDFLEFERDLANIDEVDVIPNERSLGELREELTGLQSQLRQLEQELGAKELIVNKFQAIATAYKLQKEQEKKLAKDAKLRQELIGINSTDTQNEPSNAKTYQPEAKKDWWEVLGSTIATLFEGREHQLRADRFGNRFSEITKDKSIKGIIVTAKNQHLIAGFENNPETKKVGLMQHLAGEKKEIDPNQTIAMVMVQSNDDGTFTPVDEFGNPIPQGANLIDTAIYQVFPAKELMQSYKDASGNWVRQSMFRDDVANNKTLRQELEKQYDTWRNEQLSKETISAPREISASFGIGEYVKTKNDKGVEVIDYDAQTGVTEAGLVTDADLAVDPLVSVATNNDSVTEGSVTFNTPLGRVFLKAKGGLVKLLNRKFNVNEATLMVDVLKQIAKNTFDDRTVKSKRNQVLINWLKSVAYWGIAKNTQTKERKQAGYNNIWFEDVVDAAGEPSTQLFISGKGASIPFTETSIETNRDMLVTAFTAMYNNANATMLRQKAFNDPYSEIVGLNADGTPIVKEWKNYQTFLLSSKGRNKGEVPFTTAFKPLVGENDSNRTGIYFTLTDTRDVYTFPQPAAVVKQVPVTQPAPKATTPQQAQQPAPVQGFKLDGQTVNNMQLNSGLVTFVLDLQKFISSKGDLLAAGFSVKAMPETTSTLMAARNIDERSANELIIQSVYTKLKPILDEALVPVEVPTTDVPEQDQVAFDEEPIIVPSDEVYSLQEENEVGSFENEDWTAVEKWLKENVPGVPVYRVKNIIKATNGRQAWGMFRKGAIYVYENAQVGTAYHEVFHAIFNMFTDATERKVIFDEFRNRKGTFTALNDNLEDITISYSEASDKQIEEQLAEEFKDYTLSRKIYKAEPSKNAIVRFFTELFNTIKEFFVGSNAASNTETLFKNIGEGYYKTAIPYEYNLSLAENNVIDIEDARATKDSMFSIARVPQTQVHEIMEHMTYSVLSELAKNNESLFTASVVLNKTDKYNELKDEISNLIRHKKQIITDPVAKANYEMLHYNVMLEWDSLKKKHIEYLKTYNVEFDENDEAIVRDEDASGKSDWQDARKMDNFKKINATIRLLIGTLPTMEMKADGSMKPVRSSIYGMKLTPLDKSYITLMNKLHSATNFDDMMSKLRALGNENPTYASLYFRLTRSKVTEGPIDYSKLTDEHHVQLIAGFWRAFKKLNADVQVVFTLPSGEVIVSNSALSTAATQERSNMASALIASIRSTNPYVKYDAAKKEYTSQAPVSNYKLVSDDIDTYTEFLSKFGIKLDPKQIRAKIKGNQLTAFKDAVEGLQNSLSKLSGVKTLNTKTLGIDGRLLQLGTISAILKNPEFESTYFNLNGDRVQTYLGTNLVSDMHDVISNVKNYNELGSTKYARLVNDAFSKGSATLNKMFNITGDAADGRRISNTTDLLKPAYVDGYVNEQTNKKKESSKLNFKERLIQEINLNLNGFYMNLVPGDASIEWMVNMGQFVTKNQFDNTGYDAIHKIFREYFISEVNVAREDRPIVKLKLTPKEIKAGKEQRESTDLRFFKAILSKEDHKDIVKRLSSKDSAEKIYNDFKAKIEAAVEDKIREEAMVSRMTFGKYGIASLNEAGEIVTEGVALENYDGMTEADLMSQLSLLAANYMIANIELHKLVYSDPYQYKDELKRIKNFNSPRQPLLANSQGINTMLDKAYNKGFEPTDIGYTDFIRDYFKSITLADVISKSDLKDYGVFEETDGGGYISMRANRNLRIRAGQWNSLEERQYRFDIAYEKAVKGGATKLELNELMKDNPNIKSAYTPIKPIVAGNKLDGNNWNDVVLDKFALFPLSFRLLHELNPDSNAIKLYNKMQKNDIDYAVYGTGRKVGAKTPVKLYNENGKFNNAEVNEDENVSNIPFDIIGIQAEVPSKDTNDTTQGSQITKLVTMDLMQAGVPVDFAPEITDIDERFAAWTALEDKFSYNDGKNLYNEILTNQRILEEKINYGFDTLIDQLGIVRTDKGIKLNNKKKLIDTLKDEMYKREVNDNIIEAFDSFENDEVILEATPAYQQIRNILYSIADRNISSQKINGGLKVQVPVTLLESVRAEVDPETGAYVSNELKFYEKDGERVCEIMVAKWFDDSMMTEEEAMEFFKSPEGQEVLRGVAYRIPTQSQNSIDVFKIAKFLPKGYGDSVIIPSALVKKVGSDFDIDKLSIYLKNIYKDAAGKIRLVPFHGFGEEAKAKFGELFDSITKDKTDLTEAKITKLSGMQELWSNILSGNASDKQVDKWIPIFKSMYGEELTGIEIAQALQRKLEKAGKDIDKLTNADLLAAARAEFVEKYYGKSLENAYITSLEGLITNPANFDQLTQPNDAQLLKDLAYEINEKLGIEQPDYSSTANMLSREKMTGLRQDFVTGKYAIGIAAVAQTNNAQNQRSLIYLDPTRNISAEDRHYIGDGSIALPHNQITVNGQKRATLSKITDTAGRAISDVIGMFIDGYVDISKGAWIMDLGARPNTASTWLFLTKIGVPIKTTAYFMNQPIVKQYLQTIENQGYSWLFIDQFAQDAIESFDSADVTTSEMPNEKKLGEMVGMKSEDMSPLQKAQQQLILKEFVKYAKMAEHLFKVQQATSFDTASFNDPMLLFKKNEQIKAAEKTIISSVNDILENSFVGHLREVLNDVREAYSDILVSEKPRVRATVEAVLSKHIQLNDREFVKFARNTINNLFDWATQIDRKLTNRLAATLLGSDTAVSAAQEIMNFKSAVMNDPNHPLKDNIIINALQMNKGGKDGQPDNLYLTAKDSKIYNQNQIIFGFRELKDRVPKELYGKLVRVAVLQSGLTNSKISFSSLLPYTDFKEIYNDTLAKLEEMPNLADFIDLNVMERTLYTNSEVVPSKKARWIKTKAGNWMYNLEMKFLSKRLSKAMGNKKIPQMVNISTLSREGASDIITYVWEDMKYTKAQKAEMRKKGDYSYINKGLFKKVYNSAGNPIVYLSTAKDGRVYESFVYKAINTWGDSFRANEFYGKLVPGDADSTLAQKGIFDNGYIKVDEVEDSVIEDVMGDEAVSMQTKIESEPENINEKLPCQGGVSF